MNKVFFRNKYKSLRSSLKEEEIEELSIEIANQALKLPIWEFSTYHVFLPIKHHFEVNTEYLLHILHGKDKSVVVPKVINSTDMVHYLLQDNTLFVSSKYGVPEPKSGIEINPSQLDIVFIPLLAYDTKGNRLGYGKGYYDRFLASCNNKTLFIGLSFFEAEVKVPTLATDIPLDYCITPYKIYSFKKS